jgi:multidrug resistance efflux pump
LPTPIHEETKCGHEDAYRAVAALTDTDALAEVQKLWAIGASVNQHWLDKLDAEARAEAAEAELHESEGNLAHALHQLDQAKAELAATQAKLAGLVEVVQQMLIEYDDVELDHSEPPSMTAAVTELRAALKGAKP